MIKVDRFIKCLKINDLNFSTGVPDSLLKELCFSIEDKFKKNHVAAANEGSAVGLAIGYHFKTGKIPIVYLQNSGFGNMINPILSLADKNVFNIPLFIIMGWRGEKSKFFKDEPQHITQGALTESLLKKLNIKYKILTKNSNFSKSIKDLKIYSQKNNKISCLLIKKNVFEKNDLYNKYNKFSKLMKREEILKYLVDNLSNNLNSISTTGILSRELYEILKQKRKINNLMCVGGMGHAISIATGIASQTKKKIICFDGDGSITMHLGSLATSSQFNNIIHVVFNNKSHESVGGHYTSSKHISFFKLAKNLGYKTTMQAKNKKQALLCIKKAIKNKHSCFIEILCKIGHRENISRPKENMSFLKRKFMKNLK